MQNRNVNQRNAGRNKKDTPAFNGVHAPYNFVPVSSAYVPPGWAPKTSIDVPMEIGLCAEIEVTIDSLSPMMIGAEKLSNGVVPFFTISDQPVIPGSSLRGMIRNLAEIITFSKMPELNNRYPTLRDIRSDNYKNTLIEDNKVKVEAGWLVFDPDSNRYILQTCQYARASYSMLEQAFRTRNLAKMGSFSEKYHAIGGLGQSIEFAVSGRSGTGENIAQTGHEFTGYPVMTGHAFNKKKEFIFYNEGNKEQIPEKVMSAFLAIYDKDVADKSPLAELKRLQRQSKNRVPGIPVFFTRNSSREIEYLGLTQMMKIPPNFSIGDLHPQSNKTTNKRVDIVENLFGRTTDEAIHEYPSLKSRISVADFYCQSGHLVKDPITVILGQPSPSFNPAYLVQSEGNTESQLSSRQKGFHDSEAPQLRGYKRYPIQTNVPLQPTMSQLEKPIEEYANVSTKIQPMEQGAKFSGKIRLHNVTPKELGLILWILTWGEDETLSHNIGMAKPYGYGRFKCKIDRLMVEENTHPGAWNNVTSKSGEFQEQFVSMMETVAKNPKLNSPGGWRKGPYLKELCAMAKGTDAKAAHNQYMPLKAHAQSKANDSKYNKSNGFALPAFTALKMR
ncbi:TIGR03986 family CRISPR-associated RAMP protein [Alteromonas ponticola]|uniref:TIGR03986 family CRISPR-associated RAMP protein n=1 Tax=Alteromonas aquimaris TaxID=2998417 RepID=A0ABT3P9Z9_9ALTE|nr:TIGR03986 family CRISPR-associated RAMP protein [Alteromonas aquimaris]MCW8109603.1 TIGR03986 family CRISPR-associated RAMP protein [Alteromonas aquimaris]